MVKDLLGKWKLLLLKITNHNLLYRGYMYDFSYPKEPIGGGNPYQRCVSCKKSDPAINGRVEGHLENCQWRRLREAPFGIEQRAQRQDSVVAQLRDLMVVANTLGMYDAADVIKNIIDGKR